MNREAQRTGRSDSLVIWTLEVFTCKHFGSRCFGYVRFFNIQEVQVEKCFLEPDGYPTSPGMGEGSAPGVLTVIVPAYITPGSWRVGPGAGHAVRPPPGGCTCALTGPVCRRDASRLQVGGSGWLTGGLPGDRLQRCFSLHCHHQLGSQFLWKADNRGVVCENRVWFPLFGRQGSQAERVLWVPHCPHPPPPLAPPPLLKASIWTLPGAPLTTPVWTARSAGSSCLWGSPLSVLGRALAGDICLSPALVGTAWSGSCPGSWSSAVGLGPWCPQPNALLSLLRIGFLPVPPPHWPTTSTSQGHLPHRALFFSFILGPLRKHSLRPWVGGGVAELMDVFQSWVT